MRKTGRTPESWKGSRTLKRTEATVHDELQVTQLTLREDNSGQTLGLRSQLVVAGGIAGDEVLEDTTVGRVGHDGRL